MFGQKLCATWLLALMVVAGCAAQTAGDTSPDTPTDRSSTAFDEPGIYTTDPPRRLTERQLLERLSTYTYVVVGESHGVEWHHRAQATIYRALLQHHDGGVALGMEMFQRPYQPALSAFIAGDIDESTMLQRTEYDKRWGVPPRYYRPLWSSAKSHQASLVALNARAELTRAVATRGIDSLPSALKQDLPDDLTLYDSQRKFLRGMFGAHHPSGDTSQTNSNAFERFAMAQVVWDATMAQTASRFMQRDGAPASMVIVCGRAHAHNDFGIPPRLTLADSSSDPSPQQKTVATVLPVTTDQMARAASESSTATLNSPEAADFLWVRDTQSN